MSKRLLVSVLIESVATYWFITVLGQFYLLRFDQVPRCRLCGYSRENFSFDDGNGVVDSYRLVDGCASLPMRRIFQVPFSGRICSKIFVVPDRFLSCWRENAYIGSAMSLDVAQKSSFDETVRWSAKT